MYALIGLAVNIGFGVVAGVISGVKIYKSRKGKAKETLTLTDRFDRIEALILGGNESKPKEPKEPTEPIETPSEDGYYKPENPRVFYAQ